MSERHDTRGVRAHYAQLAHAYDAQANRACKRAYARLVQSALADVQAVLELGAGSSPLLDSLSAPRKVACDLSVEMLARRAKALADIPVGCASAHRLTQPQAPGATGSLSARANRCAEAHPTGACATGSLPASALPLAVAADGQHLPFAENTFDAVFSINVLEHVPDPSAVFRESARILRPGGAFLAVTPNGDLEWLLDLLERLRLKLPEGPHRFLRAAELAALAGEDFTLREHRRFLAFPAGPDIGVRAVDRLVASRLGLFQYILAEKR